MRITDNMLLEQSIRDLNKTRSQMQRLQAQVATGKRILKPEDDPAATERALSIRATMREHTNYQRSLDQGLRWLNATELALDTVSDALQQAHRLALRMRNDTYSDEARELAATEVHELIQTVLTAANTRHQDSYIFAGYQVRTPPVSLSGDTPPAVLYAGDEGAMNLPIEPGHTVQINFPAGEGITQALETLIEFEHRLREAPNELADSISAIEDALRPVLDAITVVGSRTNRLEDVKANLGIMNIHLEKSLSEVEDTDYAEALMRLSNAETAYHVLLNVAARLPQPLLIEMLR
ncbi:MAG: flagellar hook-associated protein FlgL [Anaerolineae bacterium]|jgi:flagellar hook-associated protein 3 FlgL